MNIIAIWLLLEGTKSGLIVICKTHGSRRIFIYAHVNSTFPGRDSLPLVLILYWNII